MKATGIVRRIDDLGSCSAKGNPQDTANPGR